MLTGTTFSTRIRAALAVAVLSGALAATAPSAVAQSTSAPCENGMAGPYPCQNVDLEGFVPLPFLLGATGNDVWGWTDPASGREYGIVGTSHSTGFVDVTDAKNPEVVGRLPTRGIPDFILWRDIKVDGNYAFIVSELTDSGLQVFDLTRLRDGTLASVFTSDAAYDEFSFAHNIAINTETDFAYVVGSDTCVSDPGGVDEEAGGLHMVNISDPLNPTFAGCAIVPGDGDPDTPSNNYVHDVQCVIYHGPDADYQGREICFGSNENAVVIYDVTDKSNPEVISQTTYPTAAYTHQGWLTEDHGYFLFGDELDEGVASSGGGGTVDNTTTYIMSVSDLDNPPVPKAYAHQTHSIDHNMFIHQGRVYQSNYAAGLRILEYDEASLAAGQLREVAFFDVLPGVDINDFAGTWSNYPYFQSGIVLVSVIENELSGLFVLRPQFDTAGEEPPPDTGTGPSPGPAAAQDCANTIKGNRHNNKLIGTAGSDRISGRRGADRIKGRAGDDCLRGGRGEDKIKGGAGDDRIHVAAGRRDVVKCGPGEDVVKAGGNDRVRGCEKVQGK